MNSRAVATVEARQTVVDKVLSNYNRNVDGINIDV